MRPAPVARLHPARRSFVGPPEARVLELLLRRRAYGCHVARDDGSCELCALPHRDKLRRQMSAGRPLQLVLPGFSLKSTNPCKVLGPLPDMAEQVALEGLEELCQELCDVYPPGATVLICSDGHVVNDLVGVGDDTAASYLRHLRMALLRHAPSLRLWTLLDYYRSDEPGWARARLLDFFGEPLDALRATLRRESEEQHVFAGLARTLHEDIGAVQPALSRNAARTAAKRLAYQLLQRHVAWSRLLDACFPDAVQLSAAPYPPHAPKLSIRLIDSQDPQLVPWQGVALKRDGRFELVTRAGAEALDARLVHGAMRPSHYELS